ncbi:MAG: LptF/LptG family permease [Candidatus Hatepunaea meridiana]|nr:LptF/LptG family permease [Candidatus Hatepunaea meridiana]
MKILDKYIIYRFIGKLIWSISVATIVFLALDLVEMLDKFIDARVPMSTVIRYYYLYIPYIIYLILPVAALLATLFTIGGLTTSNELNAMQVSGVPFSRTLVLLLLTTIVLAGCGFIFGETIVPVTNRERMDIYRYDLKKLPRDARSRHGQLYMQIGKNKQLHIERYNPGTREAFGIQLVEIDEGRVIKRTDAEKMIWRDAVWYLQGSVERVFNSNGIVNWKKYPAMIAPAIKFEPNEIEKVQTKPEEMNWVELRDFIVKLQNSGGDIIRWKVDLFFKISLPLAAVIIVLFGAPIASIKRRGGTVLGFGLVLFICFIYFGFIQVGKVLGYNGTLTPLVSAWAGNVFFGLLGLGIFVRYTR